MSGVRLILQLATLTIVVVMCCGLCACVSSSEPQLEKESRPPVPLESPPPDERFVAFFTDRFEVTSLHSSSEVETQMETEGLQSFSSYRFKGKQPLPGSTSNLYPRFRLRVYRYASLENAARAEIQFISLVQDSFFYKSPMLLLRAGATLYRLDGECTFSSENWLEIDEKLVSSVQPSGEPSGQRPFRIACGGAIVE